MKISTYITLSLIILTICDDCSSKSESDCKGDCKWTAGTAASCALATCTVEGSTCKEGTTDCKFSAADDDAGTPAKCASVAASCALASIPLLVPLPNSNPGSNIKAPIINATLVNIFATPVSFKINVNIIKHSPSI